MNVNSKTGRIKLDKFERRQLDNARTISRQLAHFLEATGKQSVVARAAAEQLGDLCKMLDGDEVGERQMQEVA